MTNTTEIDYVAIANAVDCLWWDCDIYYSRTIDNACNYLASSDGIVDMLRWCEKNSKEIFGGVQFLTVSSTDGVWYYLGKQRFHEGAPAPLSFDFNILYWWEPSQTALLEACAYILRAKEGK